MPIIQCDIREGRTQAQKRALAAALTKAVHETIDAPLEYIYVLIRDTPGFHHIKAGKHLPEFTSGEPTPKQKKASARPRRAAQAKRRG